MGFDAYMLKLLHAERSLKKKKKKETKSIACYPARVGDARPHGNSEGLD
jgi:hypothetical protein